ncbi:MAG TPA: hypothetical protein P5060_01995 [Candidatus Absconditabacterales bacterium]|nr:hypothetical protein [Candidatus Absconditabacterales bacterium]
MGNTLNRAGNTLAIPIRLGGTVVTTTADLFVTLKTMGKEGCEITADTAKRVKDVLLGAWNHGKWYHKAMNIPLSPIIAGGTALEGAVRATVQPMVNGVVNTWNTGKNTVKNARKSTFGRIFSKKPLSDFSYNHLETRGLKLNNWFEKLQFKKGKSGESKKTKEITKEVNMGENKSDYGEKKLLGSKKQEVTQQKIVKMESEDVNKWGENNLKKKDEEIAELKKKLEEAKKANKGETKEIKLDNKKVENKGENKGEKDKNKKENNEIKLNSKEKGEEMKLAA